MARSILAGAFALGTFLPASARAQQLAGGGGGEISWVRVLAALAVCIVTAGATALLLRRYGPPRGWRGLGSLKARLASRRHIEIIETRRVSLHAELCLFRCQGSEYLIACGPSGPKVLSRIGLDQASPLI